MADDIPYGLGAEIGAEMAAELAAEQAKLAAAPEPKPAAEPVEAIAADPEPAEPVSEPVAATDPEPDPEPAVAAPKAKKPEPLPKWMKDRLAEQTAKQRDAERQAAEAEARAAAAVAELEALRRQPDANGNIPDTRAAPKGDFVPRSELEARAAEIARVNAFNAQADQAYYAGKAAYKDFDAALEPLTQMGALSRMDFQQAAIETGNAHDVLYALGSDPDKASQILGYLKAGNTTKAAIEMDRIARDVAGQKAAEAKPRKTPVSQVPAPIRPVGGSALPVIDLEKADDDTFDRELSKMLTAKGW